MVIHFHSQLRPKRSAPENLTLEQKCKHPKASADTLIPFTKEVERVLLHHTVLNNTQHVAPTMKNIYISVKFPQTTKKSHNGGSDDEGPKAFGCLHSCSSVRFSGADLFGLNCE
nr:hypothetical protein [Tanacetum cinerariifolium]